MLEPTADAGEPAPKAATAPSAVGNTESAGPQAENRYGLKAYEGRAPIKPEFLLKLKPRVPKQTQVVQREAEAEAGSEAALAPGAEAQAGDAVDPQTASTSEPPAKRSRRAEKREKKKWKSALEANKMCSLLIRKGECEFGDKCKFNHDTDAYLATKGEDIAGDCPMWRKQGGKCHFGVTCRWYSSHARMAEEMAAKGENFDAASVVDLQAEETNYLDFKVMNQLRARKYQFPLTDHHMANRSREKEPPTATTVDSADAPLGSLSDKEKKPIDWHHKLYLAPLTTVGNLPFRRVCKRFGADITCGEMALATSLLKGQKSEWALLRRHQEEDVFGVQLAGNNSGTMARAAELLRDIDVDFVDINSGCPIDLIYNQGMGSALMDRRPKMRDIVRAMNDVLNVPLTVKMRTGVVDTPTAHELLPQLKSWGADMVCVHGRSRKQRYTRLANWDYVIERCAKPVVDIPVFGNGDIMSYEDGLAHLDQGIDGLMIARGALIKPWLFTEIKERRHWDISSGERFDILKEYTQFGLEHWGSDTQGVRRTRRFLLEWLSFTYRYIPIGILERYPQRINEKPLPYFGRNDMETLMASPYSNDWVKISEMLLGPVGDGFAFHPKHKSNAYPPELQDPVPLAAAAGPEAP